MRELVVRIKERTSETLLAAGEQEKQVGMLARMFGSMDISKRENLDGSALELSDVVGAPVSSEGLVARARAAQFTPYDAPINYNFSTEQGTEC